MTPAQVAEIVQRELDSFRYEPAAGSLGKPWPAEKAAQGLAACRDALLPPEPITLQLRDGASVPAFLVAHAANSMDVVFIPQDNEFSLVDSLDGELFRDYNIRGDFVGTFCAA